MESLVSFLENENGATAIEYGLIAFLIGISCIIGFAATGNSVQDFYTGVEARFCAAVSADVDC